ncbi:motility protein A [Aureliella helgolandensis]|uniref:Chemotaxis protein PomA n=1 Tax=Aureliella helgolandensis TaxID=2527968 RepID=A0A518GGQ7_9BACT|nr:MotA/TolQ/ExbB proton channel family protein [Aureliella helgolandensis]QDV27738.1 Chemotaxis protein PomA [Aureliella helgolandensis]
MDITSVIGFVLAWILIIGSIMMGKAPFSAFIDIPSFAVVIGGAIAAAMMAFPLKSFLALPMVMKKAVLNKQDDLLVIINQLVSLAEVARRDGLLALESKMAEVEQPVIRSGLQMAIDGNDAETIESVMRTEMEAISRRHKEGKSILDQIARFAPAYGMIGTLMGLIMMLSDMSDPAGIGAGMAVALITTLYGAIAANVGFQPFAEKLGLLSKYELCTMEMIVRGVLAIQSGESPRALEQRLLTYLHPKKRPVKD